MIMSVTMFLETLINTLFVIKVKNIVFSLNNCIALSSFPQVMMIVEYVMVNKV